MVGDAIRCPRCGATLPQGAAFCVECGARVLPPPAPEPARRVPAPQRPALAEAAHAPEARASLLDPEGPPASTSELRDVILEQIAREVGPATEARTHRSRSAPPPRLDDELDFKLDDIEQSFDALLSAPPPGALSATAAKPGDDSEAQALFKQIAAEYLAPVRDFLIELGFGSPSKEWLAICMPSVQSLQKSAESMGLGELAQTLGRLSAAFEEVERLPGPFVGDVAKVLLDTVHQDLVQILPEAFAVSEERDRREPIIVQTLLKQVPEVRKVALDRIYAAGLTRLEMYYMAAADDIAEATGLPRPLCHSIVERFTSFRLELGASSPGEGRVREHARLAELTAELAKQTAEYDQAHSRSRGLEKRIIRKAREHTLLSIQLLLAKVGRVDLIEELEKLPFARKLEELERYLSSVSKITAGREAHARPLGGD
jgi:hypothetical protein